MTTLSPGRVIAITAIACVCACTGVIGGTGGGSTQGSVPGGGGAGNGGPASGMSGSGGAAPAAASIGQGVVRRLTRTEYNYTVRDLLGTSLTPADSFPPDVGAAGFDNASGSQTVGDSQLTAFETASSSLVEAAFADPAQRARIVTCNIAAGTTCIRSSLEAFLPRAWRRPVQSTEVDRLMALAAVEAQAGGSPEEQLKLALRGALTSVHFMYRVERDPDPTSPTPHPVSDYELASRLSYFLWSSMPDDALFGVASQGTLHQDAVLGAQIQRMLADPKATAMADVFAAQWLQLTVLDNHQPDPTLFPTVTPQVIQSMESETKLFFTDLLDNGGALHSLLDANYTFVDSALAQHYGLPAPTGTGFVKTSLDGTTRIGGLLGHASILTATSGLQHTSAVKRGAWVLGNILCAPPPPPPASVQQMLQANAQQVTMLTNQLTQRQFLQQHRAAPNCAVCHNSIDPVGLGVENYDPVGRYRTTDKGMPIDASGTMSDGTSFKDARGLSAILANDVRLAKCVAQQVFTFGLGRSPTSGEASYLDSLAAGTSDTLATVVTRLIRSDPFRQRRGGGM